MKSLPYNVVAVVDNVDAVVVVGGVSADAVVDVVKSSEESSSSSSNGSSSVGGWVTVQKKNVLSKCISVLLYLVIILTIWLEENVIPIIEWDYDHDYLVPVATDWQMWNIQKRTYCN